MLLLASYLLNPFQTGRMMNSHNILHLYIVSDGLTPLHLALVNPSAGEEMVLGVVKLLLSHGAVMTGDRHRNTPLMSAAKHGLLSVVKVLLGADANPSDTDYCRWTVRQGMHFTLAERAEAKMRDIGMSFRHYVGLHRVDMDQLSELSLKLELIPIM